MKPMSPVLVAITLSIMAASPAVLADNLLPTPAPALESDGHISWHDFIHELGSYPQVSGSMSSDGVITLSGHVNDGIEQRRIEILARKVRNATDIRSLLDAD